MHLDARQAGGHRRNAAQPEPGQRPVVLDQFALALQHVDIDGRLVVDAGGEHLAAGRRNRRVAQDDFRHHPAHGLDAERKRCHIEQQHVAIAGHEDVGLHRGAERNHFVRIEIAVRLPAEEICDQTADERNPGRSADQDHLVDLRQLQPGVGQGLTARLERPVDHRPDRHLELRSRDARAEQLRLFLVRKVPLGLNDGFANHLDFFGGPAEAGHDV